MDIPGMGIREGVKYRGFAFLNFVNAADAEKALQNQYRRVFGY